MSDTATGAADRFAGWPVIPTTSPPGIYDTGPFTRGKPLNGDTMTMAELGRSDWIAIDDFRAALQKAETQIHEWAAKDHGLSVENVRVQIINHGMAGDFLHLVGDYAKPEGAQ